MRAIGSTHTAAFNFASSVAEESSRKLRTPGICIYRGSAIYRITPGGSLRDTIGLYASPLANFVTSFREGIIRCQGFTSTAISLGAGQFENFDARFLLTTSST